VAPRPQSPNRRRRRHPITPMPRCSMRHAEPSMAMAMASRSLASLSRGRFPAHLHHLPLPRCGCGCICVCGCGAFHFPAPLLPAVAPLGALCVSFPPATWHFSAP
jgi:hypothetical protein